ncbi:MAG: MopE-related protein, partial [Myxococcaceae bacterium]
MRIFSNGRLPVLAVALATLVGCSQDARLSSALLVNVTVDSSSQAQCVRVLVRPTTGAEQDTDGLARKDELRVAVYRGEGWSNDVTVLARGYVDCGKPVDQFIEESAPKAASFPGSGTELVSLVLKAAEDVDHDGFKSPEDCDDHDATVHPGANELCTDTVDKNCSGTTGCADLACVGPCGQNGQGACVQGVCKATTEVDCTDGLDNDSDFLTDCNDPDCRGVSCNDGSACTSGETCQSNGQCGGPTSTVSCN